MTSALLITVWMFSSSLFASATATEPSYCVPANFHQLEVPTQTNGLIRAKTYKVGQLTLVGVAVGHSPIALVKDLSNKYSSFSPEEKFCTWYFNDGNDLATKWFHHRYVTNPAYVLPGMEAGLVKEYETKLSSIFADDSVSFVSCVQNHNYLAMGCDGMRHRGPTVFAMFLAYTGCSPKNAVTIANQIWGLNFVTTSTRLQIAERAYQLGQNQVQAREALQSLMTAP